MWKKIKGYENYSVNVIGQVRNDVTNHIKPIRVKNGYCFAGLSNEGKKKWLSVHRLVAINFVDNLENKREVNHKDGDKLNNKAENLEWSTRLDNIRHSIEIGLANPKLRRVKEVNQYDKDGNFIRSWVSGRSAARELNISEESLSAAANGKRKTMGGFRWAIRERTLPVLFR
jgi:hypothetical protein